MMNYPDLSIIIPTYNNGRELRRAVAGIAAQNALESGSVTAEVLIVNDCSDARFAAELARLILDFPLCRLLEQPRRSGPAAARNAGIRAARGGIIGFLDADDEWPPDKLDLLLPFFRDAAIDVAGGKIRYQVEDGVPPPEMKYEDGENRITHVHLGALLVRRAVFDRDLFFDETLHYSEDVDWWFRLRETVTGMVISEATTLIYHVHGRNMSLGKTTKELQLLQIFHASLRRRRQGVPLPQLADFRSEQPDPLISVILPLYNGKQFLKRALDSIFAQSYTHIEVIVVDDGSADGGGAFAEAHYPGIRVIRQQNAGVAAARNRGIQAANGTVIALLDQDDEWLPAKLRLQWDLLRSDPYCAFVTCNHRFICEDGVPLPANFSEKLLEEHRSFVPSALLIRKHVLLSAGMFDESLEVSSDFDLIRRLRRMHFREANIDRLLLKKWVHDHNASRNTAVLRREILGLLHRQTKGR